MKSDPRGLEPMLSVGSGGKYVYVLHALLNKYGASLKVDGILGALTKQAVINYQKKNGLLADGVVGPKTWGVLSAKFKSDITIIVNNASPAQKAKWTQTESITLGGVAVASGVVAAWAA